MACSRTFEVNRKRERRAPATSEDETTGPGQYPHLAAPKKGAAAHRQMCLPENTQNISMR